MAKRPWEPESSIRLKSQIILNADAAKSLGYGVTHHKNGTITVYRLSTVAGKYKLARSLKGMEFEGYHSLSTERHYEAQIKHLLSFTAFEAFAGLREWNEREQHNRRKWFSLSAELDDFGLAQRSRIRAKIQDQHIESLKSFVEERNTLLRDKIDDFKNGNMAEAVSISAALRNGLAHGKFGSRGEYAPVCKLLQPFLLELIDEMIERDIRRIRG